MKINGDLILRLFVAALLIAGMFWFFGYTNIGGDGQINGWEKPFHHRFWSK